MLKFCRVDVEVVGQSWESKDNAVHALQACVEVEVQLYAFVTLALQLHAPAHFTPLSKETKPSKLNICASEFFFAGFGEEARLVNMQGIEPTIIQTVVLLLYHLSYTAF